MAARAWIRQGAALVVLTLGGNLWGQGYPVETVGSSSPRSLRHWTALGPFFSNTVTGDPFDEIGLRTLGYAGAEGDAAAIEKWLASSERSLHGRSQSVATDSEFLDFQDFYGKPRVKDAPATSVYAFCRIRTDRTGVRYLLVGSSDREKVWVNGRLLPTGRDRHGVFQYTSAIPIELVAGENYLEIKVARYGYTWGLTAAVEPTLDEAINASLAGQEMQESLLLERDILVRGEAAVLAPRGVPANAMLDTCVEDLGGRVLLHRSVRTGAAFWHPPSTPGLYRVVIHSPDGCSYAETFCAGDPAALVAVDAAAAARLPADRPGVIAISGLLHRADLLLAPANRSAGTAAQRDTWERRLVYALRESETALPLEESGCDSLRDRPGLHLGGFRSNLDGSSQYYRIYVPSSYRRDNSPLALALVLPTTVSAARPFLDSAFMAAQSEAERMAAIAERHGIGLLWCGYREKPCGGPVEYAHLEEVLTAVGKEYRLDPERITLLGACSAGAIGTADAVRWPKRFAGLALLNPLFRLVKAPSPDRDAEFGDNRGYREWKNDDNAILGFLDLPGFPTFIIHDGAEPGHGDLKVAQAFADLARQFDFPLRFERRKQGLSQHFSAWEDLIGWLADQRRTTPSPERASEYFPGSDRVGSASDCFARPFVIVRGTGGTAIERKLLRAVAAKIARQWETTCFSPGRMVDDTAFNAAAYDGYNWILVGSPDTNCVWAASAARLPVQLHAQGATFYGRTIDGEGLTVIAALRREGNPGARLLLIGAFKPEQLRLPAVVLPTDGWFSSSAWSADSSRPRLLFADIR